jgi:O-antigen/teichoic acid export membrane protein
MPLGVITLLISLNANIPRYVIERQLGTPMLGMFAALAYALAVGNTVVGALGQSTSPRLARYYAAGDRAAFLGLLRKLVGTGALLGFCGVAVTSVAGQSLLRLLYGAEYADLLGVLLWLMIGGGISYVAAILGYAMTAVRAFHVQAPLFLATSGVTIVSCWLLIPRYQLSGAALALALAAGFQLLGSAMIIAFAVRRLDTRKDVRP